MKPITAKEAENFYIKYLKNTHQTKDMLSFRYFVRLLVAMEKYGFDPRVKH